MVIFLLIIILDETFFWRYIIGVFICLIGSGMIILNENKKGTKK